MRFRGGRACPANFGGLLDNAKPPSCIVLTSPTQCDTMPLKGGSDMAKTGSLNIRIDSDLKERVHGILEASGLTASVAIDMYYRQIARCNGIPFRIIAPEPNEESLEAIKEAEEIGKTQSYRFKNAEEMFESLGI